MHEQAVDAYQESCERLRVIGLTGRIGRAYTPPLERVYAVEHITKGLVGGLSFDALAEALTVLRGFVDQGAPHEPSPIGGLKMGRAHPADPAYTGGSAAPQGVQTQFGLGAALDAEAAVIAGNAE